MNKLRAFILDPMVRRCVDQRKNKLTFKDKIVLVSLRRVGGENLRLLGVLILAHLYIEAVQGLNTTVYVDEADRFGIPILESLMSELPVFVSMTKLRGLDVEQTIAFRTTMKDSKTLTPEFYLEGDQLQIPIHQLGDYQAYVREGFEAVKVFTYPLLFPETFQSEKIRARCASQCTQPIEAIDKRLGRFFA